MVLLGAGGAALAIITGAIHLGVKRILVFVRGEISSLSFQGSVARRCL